MSAPISFAIRHGADVHNYGDVLFPRLIRQEILERLPQATFEFLAATDAPCDALQSQRVDADPEKGYDVALFAGGEVIHRLDDMLVSIYERFGHRSIARPTDLIFGLGDARARFKALIGVGCPVPTIEVLEDLPTALGKLDHVSVRGRLSRDILRNAATNRVSVIPDLGWLIPKLARNEGWRSAFVKENFGLEASAYISAQAIPGNVHSSGGIESALQTFLDISLAHNMPVVLVPLTDCWDDHSVHEQLKALSNGRILSVPASLSYEERGMIVAESAFYVGQSLHGLLTANAHGRPGFLVCAHANDQKFRETMESRLLRPWRVTNWSQIPPLLRDPAFTRADFVRDAAASARDALEAYFDVLCALIRERVARVA